MAPRARARTLRLLLGAAVLTLLASAASASDTESGPGPGPGATRATPAPAAPTADGWQPISLVTVSPEPVPAPAAAPDTKLDLNPDSATAPELPFNVSDADRQGHARALRHPVHTRLQHFLKPKRLPRPQPQDSMASNKVEVFVAAPPSMLGSFSTLGGPSVRNRVAPHEKHAGPAPHGSDSEKKTASHSTDKLHAQETRYLLDSRVSFPYELLPPPMALSRPMQYKNPTDDGSHVRKQPLAAADEQRQQFLYLGHPHVAHPQQSQGFKFIQSPGNSGSLSFFDRPQLPGFPQQLGIGSFLQGTNPFSQSAPIYGQPAPELFRKDSPTQSPLFFRGHHQPQQPARPLQFNQQQQPPHQQSQPHQQQLHQPSLGHQIPDFRFVPPLTSSALDHSPFAALTQTFIPPADRTKGPQNHIHSGLQVGHQGGFNQGVQTLPPTTKHPFQQSEAYNRYVPEKQSHILSSSKPGFHLKDVQSTKETFTTKRPQIQKPLIPSPQFPADDFEDHTIYSQPKPSKHTIVNFGTHDSEDYNHKRPLNKIKLTEGNPIDSDHPTKATIAQIALKDERPPHSYSQIQTPHKLIRPLSQPFHDESESVSFPPRVSFNKDDAKDASSSQGGPSRDKYPTLSIQQRPPEKVRFTRPYFQDELLGHDQQASHHNPTSPNYGPQTFPTPPNFSLEHRPYVPLFSHSSTTEAPESNYLTTPFREETTVPPTHINEVHSFPLRTTSSTRHRFQANIRDDDEEAAVAPPPSDDDKTSFQKRPPKIRRRKPSSTTSTTTTEATIVQYERDYQPATEAPISAVEIHELQYQIAPHSTQGTGDIGPPASPPASQAPIETPYTTTTRPPRRKKPSRSNVNERLRNRLVPPELIKTTTPEPETTTNFPFYETTTNIPDFSDFHLQKEHRDGQNYEQSKPFLPQITAPQLDEQIKKQAEEEYPIPQFESPSNEGFSEHTQTSNQQHEFRNEEDQKQDFPQENYPKHVFSQHDYLLRPDFPQHTEEVKSDLSDQDPQHHALFPSPDTRPKDYEQYNYDSILPTIGSQLQPSNVAPTSSEFIAPSSHTEIQAAEEPQTTSAPPVETTTPSLSSRLRPRIRYNSTRPRFSVKDYTDRKKPGKDSAETTELPRPDPPTRVRYPTRTRGSHRHTTEKDSDASTAAPESNRLKYRTKDPLRFNSNRYRSTTSTTTTEAPSDTAESGTEVREKSPDAKSPVISRFRPGTGKYYSRYRTSTSTESPQEPTKLDKPSIRLPLRTKGVFSVRRPHTTATSKSEDEEESQNIKPLQDVEDDAENYPRNVQGDSVQGTTSKTHIQRFSGFTPPVPSPDTDTEKTIENEVVPSTSRSRIAPSPSATPTAPTSLEESLVQPSSPAWAESSLSPRHPDLSDVHIDSSSEDMMLSPSQRVAELTSSPGNHYNNPSSFKSVMPASRRTPLKVSFSTDDPILPIEAFFNSWNKDEKTS